MQKVLDDFDVVQVAYDEPYHDVTFNNIKKRLPDVLKIEGVIGIDEAYRRAANIASKEYVFIIDGDCIPRESFYNLSVDESLLQPDQVLSWASKNNVNGLVYGNGGIKLWNRDTLMGVNSHSNGNLDFHHTVKYYQMSECIGDTMINGSYLQAFRTGFREGIRLSTLNGKTVHNLKNELHIDNYRRLITWCFVGSDVENGTYAMAGAAYGFYAIYNDLIQPDIINDYSKLNHMIETNFNQLIRESIVGTEWIIKKLGVGKELIKLNPTMSKIVKEMMNEPIREGYV